MKKAPDNTLKNDRYAPVINTCCLLFMFVNMGITSTTFPVFQPYINALPFMTDTLGSWLVALRMFSAFLATFLAEEFYAKFDCRKGIFLMCLMAGLGMMFYAFAPNFAVLCLGSACAGITYGLGGTVAMTLVIGRWFVSGKSTALGIASMGSGLAAIVLPPILTRAIETGSLQLGFSINAGICVAIGLVIAGLLKDYPPRTFDQMGEGIGTGGASAGARTGADGGANTGAGANAGARASTGAPPSAPTLSPFDFRCMQIAIMLLGMGSIGLNSYLSVFMRTSGFDAYTTAFLLSISGVFLMVSKPINGIVIDRIGSHRGTAVFFGFFIIGTILLCLTPLALFGLAAAAIAITYTGQSLASVGVSTWALDFSDDTQRAKVIERFQLFYTAGTCICNLFPGLLFDLCGTYLVSYVMFAACICGSALLVLRTYRAYKP